MGDPLCGWCVIENKCSRRPFCQDNNESGRYLTQGSSDSCINSDSVTITPQIYVIDTQQLPHQVLGIHYDFKFKYGFLTFCLSLCPFLFLD